jgi:TRAP-type C4-dicarboxylate transport system substrate-binding protein
MKKMKLVSMLLALVMVISLLGACGGSTDSSSDDQQAAEPTASADASDDAAAGDDSDAATVADVDPMTITFTTTFNETETGGEIIQYFIDYLNEHTNGAIDVSITWGGTLYDTAGELEAISSGAVNMAALGHMPHIGTLNYLAFPGFAPGGTQAALDYFQTLMFDDPETSALIQGEAADNNIKYLNIIAGGANAFCSKNAFDSLDNLVSVSSKFGNMDAAIFEKLGFQVSAIGPGDTYDSLQRGAIDASQMGFAPMVSMSWQDVASYWALDGTYTAGNPFTCNLDWWNGLTEAQQNAIQEAADATQAYSATIYDDAIDGDIATVEEATGNQFVEFSDADIEKFWSACFEAKADSALETATANGKREGMITILKKAAEITNYDWTAPEE